MIELVIDSRRHDLGGFEVGRVLPFARHRMVGPFVFFDHMGPIDMPAGVPRSADVRPHPHIGLSTVTYLFAGEMRHQDSLGFDQPIRPGEVNWMTAGTRHHPLRAFRWADPRPRRALARHPGLGRAAGQRWRRSTPPSPTTTDRPTCPTTRARA